MNVQVNSDKTIAVDASMKRFVETEVNTGLKRFEGRVTRVEVHLSDIDGKKSGQADKRVLLEARPAGGRPMSATAISPRLATSVKQAIAKMRRELTTYFDRHTKAVTVSGAPSKKKKPVKKVVVKKAAVKKAATPAPAKKAAAKQEEPVPADGHSPSKKRIYQARRKPWPAR